MFLDFSTYSIVQIKEVINCCPQISDEMLQSLAADPRSGVKKLGLSLIKKKEQQQAELVRLDRLFQYEDEARSKGIELIAGVDEAGRGPLAGPVVAGTVILPARVRLFGLNDSKLLTPAQRERLYLEIADTALDWGIGVASSEEIDSINIYQATMLAMKRALGALKILPGLVLVDGAGVPKTKFAQRPIVGGDGLSASIAAASIMAKVTRDRLMLEYHQLYPDYGFDAHKGYGTRGHLAALNSFGPCFIHRRSFFPVKALLYPKKSGNG